MAETKISKLAVTLTTLIIGYSSQALAAEERGAGLPQLDVATWPSQLFWLVVLFGAGYIVMSKLVTPRIGMVLEERRNALDGNLEKARNASAEAAKIRAEYEKDLETARSEAARNTKNAAAKAARNAEDTEARTAQKIANKVAKAEAKLAEAKNTALGNLNDVAAVLAIEAVSKIAGISVTSVQASKVAKSISSESAKQGTD